MLHLDHSDPHKCHPVVVLKRPVLMDFRKLYPIAATSTTSIVRNTPEVSNERGAGAFFRKTLKSAEYIE